MLKFCLVGNRVIGTPSVFHIVRLHHLNGYEVIVSISGVSPGTKVLRQKLKYLTHCVSIHREVDAGIYAWLVPVLPKGLS